MDSNVADVERAVCAGDRHPLADMAVRDRHLRRSRHLPQGGHGVNAPVARPKDFPTMALGLVCSRQAKDVVAGYRRVRAYKFVDQFVEAEDGTRTRTEEPSYAIGEALESVLLKCFQQSALNPEFRLRELRVDHSPVEPRAYLEVGEYEVGRPAGKPALTHILVFAGDPAPAAYPPKAPDVVEYITRLREEGLMTMVGLFRLAIQLPPANDTGPSVDADEPGRFAEAPNVQTPTDRRRAPTRKRHLGS